MTMERNATMRMIYLTMALATVLFATGCSATPRPNLNAQDPLHSVEVLENVHGFASDIYDPLEGMNRRIYSFNYYFDKFIFLPIVNTYAFIMPDYAEDRVSNFVDNIFEFDNFTNNLLQGKFKRTGITLARFLTNTTVGIAGLWDPATGWGMPRQPEDFGQTLGHYGVGNGPFLVLPVLGPSNLRDTTGIVVDTVAFNTVVKNLESDWMEDNDVRLIFSAVAAVDKRHRTAFRYYESGSPFEYGMIRMLYTSKREIQIAR